MATRLAVASSSAFRRWTCRACGQPVALEEGTNGSVNRHRPKCWTSSPRGRLWLDRRIDKDDERASTRVGLRYRVNAHGKCRQIHGRVVLNLDLGRTGRKSGQDRCDPRFSETTVRSADPNLNSVFIWVVSNLTIRTGFRHRIS